MGKSARHAAINDIIARGFGVAGVPISREPSGLVGNSLLRLDGISLIPWSGGKHIAWDATITTTLAESYIGASVSQAGSAAEIAAAKKVLKYAGLSSGVAFQPVSLEFLGPSCSSTANFIKTLGQRISAVSGGPSETTYLRQRLSICLMRYNAVLLHYSFKEPERDMEE